nr:MAG TPA: hypothetical protein [Caudoviricetes sp.]
MGLRKLRMMKVLSIRFRMGVISPQLTLRKKLRS